MKLLRAAAVAVAVGVFVLGVARGTWAVGGSDSSCYGLMAQAFARGQLQPASPLARTATWPNAPLSFAPGGFVPSEVRADAASPVCAPGFSLLLAPLYALGGADAIFLLTPLAGAVLIYLTFVLGRQLGHGLAGLLASIVVASSPVFVFQLVQPMNDVLVAMLWTLAVVVATGKHPRPIALGLIVGLAVLVRPNLAPAGVVMAMWCLRWSWGSVLEFCGASLPFAIVLLGLNASLYGHPLRSGYGEMNDLFALNHVGVNLQNYGRALFQTQLAFPLIGLAALPVVARERRAVVWLVLAVTMVTLGVYAIYRPFPEWWYLRFLLPALPMLTVLALVTVSSALRHPAIVVVAIGLVVAYTASSPQMREALDLQRLERRFRLAGEIARTRLPEDVIYLSVWNSGSVRYHADREVIVWDALDQASLAHVVDWITERGAKPYLMIEDWEEPLFRDRFAKGSELGHLDWPPRFDIDRRIKIYDFSDRAAYVRGENVATEFVRGNRR